MSDEPVDPYDEVRSQVDEKIAQEDIDQDQPVDKVFIPAELSLVKDNVKFIQELQEHPVKKGEYVAKVYGFEVVDFSALEKDNIWNRSIYSNDKICRRFLNWRLVKLQQYQKKKRKISGNYLWLLILLGCGGIAIIGLIFILNMFGVA